MVDLSIQRGFLLSALLLILPSYVSIDIVVFSVYQHTNIVSSVFRGLGCRKRLKRAVFPVFEAMRDPFGAENKIS